MAAEVLEAATEAEAMAVAVSEAATEAEAMAAEVRPNGTGFKDSCLPKAELARASRG